MKDNYLKELRGLLDRYQMEENEKVDIINDYDDMYNNWIDQGMDTDEVEAKLGEPRKIIGALVEGYKRVKKPEPKGQKIIAVSPFIALVIFFVGGFAFDRWDISWMAFLIIPVIAIVVEMGSNKDEHLTTALSPFIASVAYFVLGYFYGYWHPGWLVFLIVPIIAIFNSRKEMNGLALLISLSPFAALIAFFILGEQGYWNPGWLVFLATPMLGILVEESFGKKVLYEALMILGIVGYLYIGDTYNEWGYALFAFAPIVIAALFMKDIVIGVEGATKEYRILVLVSASIYILLGVLFGLWGFAWVVFFIVPVYAIYTETSGNERVIAITPFIATTLFMALGYFFGIWEYAWLAFLIIPVTAIIKET